MQNDKVLSMLGIAAKSGNVVSGEFSTEKAVKTGHAYLVIVSEEASDNTRKSFMNMTEFYDVPCYCYGSKEALGRCTERRGVLSEASRKGSRHEEAERGSR